MAGGSRRYTSADGAVTGIKARAFKVSSTAVIAQMDGAKRDGLGAAVPVNFLTEFNISAASLDAGDLYGTELENGCDTIITSFQITSGTIVVYF